MDFDLIKGALQKEPGRRIKMLRFLESRTRQLKSIQTLSENQNKEIQRLEDLKIKVKGVHDPIKKQTTVIRRHGIGAPPTYFDYAPPFEKDDSHSGAELIDKKKEEKTDIEQLIKDVLNVMKPNTYTAEDARRALELSFKAAKDAKNHSDTLFYELCLWLNLRINDLNKYANPGVMCNDIAKDIGRSKSSIRTALSRHPFRLPEKLTPKKYYTKKEKSKDSEAPIHIEKEIIKPEKELVKPEKKEGIQFTMDNELQVMSDVYQSMKHLSNDAKIRILDWLKAKFTSESK
jgi:hypothetical protein